MPWALELKSTAMQRQALCIVHNDCPQIKISPCLTMIYDCKFTLYSKRDFQQNSHNSKNIFLSLQKGFFYFIRVLHYELQSSFWEQTRWGSEQWWLSSSTTTTSKPSWWQKAAATLFQSGLHHCHHLQAKHSLTSFSLSPVCLRERERDTWSQWHHKGCMGSAATLGDALGEGDITNAQNWKKYWYF